MPANPQCVVAHLTAETGFSGGETQVFGLMEGLRERGHRNLLLCPPGSRSEEESRRRGIEWLDVDAGSAWSPRCVASVTRALRRAAPDVVHLHSGRAAWLGSVAARRLGLPALVTRRMDRRVRRSWRTRFVYAQACSRVVAISDAVARQLEAGGVPRDRLRVIPSAVDPERLRVRRGREEVRDSLGADRFEPCILAAGALVPRKGFDVLIDALSLLARDDRVARLWIAGEGPQRAALQRRALRRGVAEQLRLLGRRDDVADLLGACDVFAMPSRREGLGVAALEAMALARPVVATRVGGLAEAVVHERTGLLVPPDDSSALAEALARLVADPDLASRLGRAGPTHIAARHGRDAMVSAYEQLYAELLAESRGAS
jgi:glycosyltransferase involved in cell wall biosynthesis